MATGIDGVIMQGGNNDDDDEGREGGEPDPLGLPEYAASLDQSGKNRPQTEATHHPVNSAFGTPDEVHLGLI